LMCTHVTYVIPNHRERERERERERDVYACYICNTKPRAEEIGLKIITNAKKSIKFALSPCNF